MKAPILLIVAGVLVLPRPGFCAAAVDDDDDDNGGIPTDSDVEHTIEEDLPTRTSKQLSNTELPLSSNIPTKLLPKFLQPSTAKSFEKPTPLDEQITDDEEDAIKVKKSDPSTPVAEAASFQSSLKPTQPTDEKLESTAAEVLTSRKPRKKLSTPAAELGTESDKEHGDSLKTTATVVTTAKLTGQSEATRLTTEFKENEITSDQPKTPKPNSNISPVKTTAKTGDANVEEVGTPSTPAEKETGTPTAKEEATGTATAIAVTTVVAVKEGTTPEDKATTKMSPPSTAVAKLATTENIRPGKVDVSGEEDIEDKKVIPPPPAKAPKPVPVIPTVKSDDSEEIKLEHEDEDITNSNGRQGMKDSDAGNSDVQKEKDDTPYKPISIDDEDTGNTRFFIFLVIAVAVVLLIYMAYINRAKVLAIVVEGWSGRGASSGRTRGSSSSRNGYQYQPLATRPANNGLDSARRPLTGDEDDDDDDTHIIVSAPVGSGSGGSSGRRSPAANQDSVIVVDKQTLQAVKNYVY